METRHAQVQQSGKIPELPSLECLKGRLAQSRREASVLKKLIRLKVELSDTPSNLRGTTIDADRNEVSS